ncbi:MAG TPA: hypothetical protein VLE23_20040, partial [Geminicoccaceae bacterium]|nr:hypothetical protein [Geminicoccaceae bacterium]
PDDPLYLGPRQKPIRGVATAEAGRHPVPSRRGGDYLSIVLDLRSFLGLGGAGAAARGALRV